MCVCEFVFDLKTKAKLYRDSHKCTYLGMKVIFKVEASYLNETNVPNGVEH